MNKTRSGDKSPAGWGRLWAAVRPHGVDPGALGEYAAVLSRRGPVAAQRAYPTVVAHLARGCEVCAEDLRGLAGLLERAGEKGRADVAYFHLSPVVRAVDALWRASDALGRIRPELEQALAQVRELRGETEHVLEGLTTHVSTRPHRARRFAEETEAHIGVVEDVIGQLIREVDAIRARYHELSDQRTDEPHTP
jgi:hypothetical protein